MLNIPQGAWFFRAESICEEIQIPVSIPPRHILPSFSHIVVKTAVSTILMPIGVMGTALAFSNQFCDSVVM